MSSPTGPASESDGGGLDAELGELRTLVADLRVENQRLLTLLRLSSVQAQPPGPAQTGIFDGLPGGVDVRSSAAAKVAFFRTLFAARPDVHAVRWENRQSGKSGWMPAIRGRWRRGEPPDRRQYLPLTDEVMTAHLSGEIDVGLYPMLDGDRTCWLAADFDGASAVLDALAYLKAARAVGAPAALEVSRSGLGAHVWLFFTTAVPAALARQVGAGLLREAIALRGRMELTSYDRLFPSQDVLPAGGVGNLIAAPLQGRCRKRGATVFLDMATLEPHQDQWAYLSSVVRMSPREVARLARQFGDVRVGSAVDKVRPSTSTSIRIPLPAAVHAHLDSMVTVVARDLPPDLLATLKHAASMPNPVFYERQRRRASTWDTPRFIRSYDETSSGDLVLPRGLAGRLENLVSQAGSRLDITDRRTAGVPYPLTFHAVLEPEQKRALDEIVAHELGILVAPPGAGKTVIACAAIAQHRVSTLVLVDRKALADQWRVRISQLLDVNPGQRGAGRAKTTGLLDIMTLQSLSRAEDILELTAPYGFVVVDECHHVPAVAFQQAVQQIPARRWLGLTATPYRRDQLDELIALQLGPVRHTIAAPTHGVLPAATARAEVPEPVLHVHQTEFSYEGPASPSDPGGMAAIYRSLVADDHRTRQIVADVLDALTRGRHCVVLTQWKDHVGRIVDALQAGGLKPAVLVGGIGARARKGVINDLVPSPNGPPLLLVGTGPYIGEGFDCPALDTLFLAAPIASKGRLVQYVGRVLRPYPGKRSAEVHDYHDYNTGVLASSLAKRAAGYTSLGFVDPRRVTR
ncbi:superfamily II DNA or RNA helicase [Nakamurella sp. UYEF19]|uniref:TOTE conflict system archaeo-eukaryotic primase domain-containing protein n=1 Tax=Nakamurella sp. UYEF19 TaxID=1756392 RepID=UPI0033986855